MVEAARLQEREGCVGFTCATPAEVECLLDHGYNDLTWAHQPVGAPKVGFAVAANRRGRVRVALDSMETAAPLSEAAPSGRSGRPLSDRGGHRFGAGRDRTRPGGESGRTAGHLGGPPARGHHHPRGTPPRPRERPEGSGKGGTVGGRDHGRRGRCAPQRGIRGRGGIGRIHTGIDLHARRFGDHRSKTRHLRFP